LENNIASVDELDALEKSAEQEIQEAIQFAESSPEPPAEDLFKHVYVEAG
jgi:TPP-dependent pyruvate/acetoin dehydrogenase alpha subunit